MIGRGVGGRMVCSKLKLVGFTITVDAGRWHADDYRIVLTADGGRSLYYSYRTSMFGVHVPFR